MTEQGKARPAWYAKNDSFGQRAEGGGGGKGGNIKKFPPRRFWMEYPATKKLVFIDSPIDTNPINEYTFPMNGQWNKAESLTSTMQGDCPLMQRFGKDYRWVIKYCTVVDVDGYKDRKGEAITCEIKLQAVKGQEYQKYVLDTSEDGPLAYNLVTMRRASKDDARQGEIKQRHRVVDPFALFPACRYSGKMLSEWWDEAEKDPIKMSELQDVFSVEFDAAGKLLRKVVPFNYDVVLAPKSHDEILAILAEGAPVGKNAAKPNARSAPAAAASANGAPPPPSLADIFGKDLFPGGANPTPAAPATSIDDDSHIPF